MDRFLLIVFILVCVMVIGVILCTYLHVTEPFVIVAARTPKTHNTTGIYTDDDYYYCRREDDTRTDLPTCKEMRKGMIQKAKDDGQVPDIPHSVRHKYPETDETVAKGGLSNLQIILNRAAKPERHQTCNPFVNCDTYVNPKTRKLYCPVGMAHSTDHKGNTIGCASFPRHASLYCETDATEGSGRVSCNILRNIQTVSEGFRLYPPQSLIEASVDKSVLDALLLEKSEIILNMIQSYPDLLQKAGSQSKYVSMLETFYEGVMNSYVLYQPVDTDSARVGYMKAGSSDILNIRSFAGEGPNYEILASDFIPDVLDPPDGLMPIVKTRVRY